MAAAEKRLEELSEARISDVMGLVITDLVHIVVNDSSDDLGKRIHRTGLLHQLNKRERINSQESWKTICFVYAAEAVD
jgi:hypothetical protein